MAMSFHLTVMVLRPVVFEFVDLPGLQVPDLLVVRAAMLTALSKSALLCFTVML